MTLFSWNGESITEDEYFAIRECFMAQTVLTFRGKKYIVRELTQELSEIEKIHLVGSMMEVQNA